MVKKRKRSSKKSECAIIQSSSRIGRVIDAPMAHWVYRLMPRRWLPYAQLARWDRPIGWQLLMWPCWWSVLLALQHVNVAGDSLLFTIIKLFLLFFIGSVAMRGAGCTWNDLVDQDIDNRVARTRSRPLPSRQVSRRQAKLFMVAQCLVGFVVLMQFNTYAIILGLCSLFIVVVYPFMKRLIDWPQLVLGLAFNWGALLGWASVQGSLAPPAVLLYLGSILWTIGYDTIYAHQDKEDDALVGVRSTARLFAHRSKFALSLLYGGFIAINAVAFCLGDVGKFGYIFLGIAALHLGWQIVTLKIDNQDQCLRLFKSNTVVGIYLSLGLCLSLLQNAV